MTVKMSPVLDVLARWNRWGRARLDPGLPRDVFAEVGRFVETPETVALAGPRRAGKSTVLYQVVDALVRSGIPETAILHVNLEEPLLAPSLDLPLLDRLYDAYRESVYPEGRAYVFLDEVQRVPGWERWVRARSESEDVKVFVTGSSSALLSREMGTLLTGRHVTFPVLPLSFREFLRFEEIPVPARLATAGRPPRLIHALERYLAWGGFPEVVLAGDERRKEILLKQYFEDVLYRDVALRHQIRDVSALRALAVQILSQTAGLVSFQKLARVLGTSLDLVRAYARHLEEAFLLALLPYHSLKTAERLRRPQKVHAIDTGLRNAVCLSDSADRGRVAETAAYLALRRRASDGIFYWAGRHEVDLVVRRSNRVEEIVQVVFDRLEDEAVRAREIGGLDEAARRFPKARRLLVTGGRGPESSPELEVVPLWRFLLGET